MLSSLSDKLRAFAHRKLEGGGPGTEHALASRIREVANTVNDLLGRPIRGADDAVVPVASRAGNGGSAAVPGTSVPGAEAPGQAPVVMYFDGKDHRTKAKVEQLLRARDIAFKILDVADDESERSWITTAAKQDEFPIVVIAGTPVGGLAELTQLDVQGDLKRLVFGTT